VLMLIGVYYFDITSGGNTTRDTLIAGGLSIAWLVGGFAFLWIRQMVSGTPILHPEDHKIKNGIVSPPPVETTA